LSRPQLDCGVPLPETQTVQTYLSSPPGAQPELIRFPDSSNCCIAGIRRFMERHSQSSDPRRRDRSRSFAFVPLGAIWEHRTPESTKTGESRLLNSPVILVCCVASPKGFELLPPEREAHDMNPSTDPTIKIMA